MLEDGGGEAYAPAGETLIPKHIVGRKNDHTLYQHSEGSAPNGDVTKNSVGRPGKAPPRRGPQSREPDCVQGGWEAGHCRWSTSGAGRGGHGIRQVEEVRRDQVLWSLYRGDAWVSRKE